MSGCAAERYPRVRRAVKGGHGLISDYSVRRLKVLDSALSHIKPVRDHFGDWRVQRSTSPCRVSNPGRVATTRARALLRVGREPMVTLLS